MAKTTIATMPSMKMTMGMRFSENARTTKALRESKSVRREPGDRVKLPACRALRFAMAKTTIATAWWTKMILGNR